MRGLATLFILASALVVTPTYSDEGTTLKGPKGVDTVRRGALLVQLNRPIHYGALPLKFALTTL